MEVLAAFVREHSLEKWPPQDRHVGPRPTLRPDVQAAMTVIGRRTVSYDRQPINLTDANLAGVELEKANLTGVNFYFANLTSAWLVDAKLINTNLTAADLTNANLYDANLAGADLGTADLTGVDWPVDVAVPDHWRRGVGGDLEHDGINPGVRATKRGPRNTQLPSSFPKSLSENPSGYGGGPGL